VFFPSVVEKIVEECAVTSKYKVVAKDVEHACLHLITENIFIFTWESNTTFMNMLYAIFTVNGSP
jgi:hypothetical protein